MKSTIDKWLKAKEQAKKYKDLENSLRIQVFKEFFPGVSGIGTWTKLLDENTVIEAAVRWNFTVDKEQLPLALSMLPLAKRSVVTYTPSVREGEYKKLSPADAQLLALAVSKKPGLPSLEIKACKLRQQTKSTIAKIAEH